MNILLYVVTLLLVLSAMTYAKWNNFESSIGLQKAFMQYMGTVEKNGSFSNADTWYHRIKVRKNQTGKKESDKTDKNTSIGRLSFHLLLRKTDREQYSNEYQQIRQLAKRLMNVLYGKHPIFIEIAAKRPNYMDEILDEIQSASEKFTEKEQIKETLALSNLEFIDRDLHHTFFLMMRGTPEQREKKEPIDKEMELEPIDTDDEEDHASESKESTSKGGYISLTDMISVKNVFKIRVFLASKPLLLAIYGDSSAVENVVEKRAEIYRQLRRSGADGNASSKELQTLQTSLTKEFENECSRLGLSEEFRPILDFTVSKTNPSRYE